MATMVLTGASAGIGAAAAIELTRQGHQVIATGRSQQKLDRVHEKMLTVAASHTDVPEPMVADLSSLAEVRRLAKNIIDRCPALDVLVNNAGLQTSRRELSPDGFELHFAVNHLAPFLLTNLVLARVTSSGGRVITTASGAHRFARLDFDDLQFEHDWRAMRSYGTSKLANILFTIELRRRSSIAASSFHPGLVYTDLGRSSGESTMWKLAGRFIMRTPIQGADTLVWLATGEEGGAPGSPYYANRNPAKLPAIAQKEEWAARLWDESMKLVGLT